MRGPESALRSSPRPHESGAPSAKGPNRAERGRSRDADAWNGDSDNGMDGAMANPSGPSSHSPA